MRFVPGIFLSYRRDDSAGYAGRLRDSLEERVGRGEVFRDVDTLEPGQDFVATIDERVHACRVFLTLIGRDWLEARDRSGTLRLQQPGDYVRREVAVALARDNVVVIPVLTEGAGMPAEEQLPEDMRALVRREAITLRDESWDGDVDRLAAAIHKILGTTPAGAGATAVAGVAHRRGVPLLVWAAMGAALLAVALLVPRLTRPGGGASARGASGAALRIAVPHVSEMVLGREVYTLLWGSLARHGRVRTLRLRMRFVNEGESGAATGDDSFRLLIGNREYAPVDPIGRMVPAMSIEQGEVLFEVPGSASSATLRVRSGGKTAELPLDLTPGAPVTPADTADPGDALSRAVTVELPVATDNPAFQNSDVTITPRRYVVRRFANLLQVFVWFDFANHSDGVLHFGPEPFRLVVDGETREPFVSVSEDVRKGSSDRDRVIFEVPPGTEQVVVRITWHDAPPVDIPLDLRPALR